MPTAKSEQLAADGSYHCSVDSTAGADWDRIVASFVDGVIDQTWSYAAACWGEENLSTLVLRQEGEVVAACLTVLLRPPLLAGGIAHVKFGPLWRPDAGCDNPAHMRQAAESLRQEYVEKRGMFLRVMPQACAAHAGLVTHELINMGFKHEDVADAERFMVALSHPLDQLRAGLKSKWRYHLKKSEQRDLTVDRGADADRLAEFLSLYAAMRERKTFADARALKQLPRIHEDLAVSLKPVTWLCRAGGEPVAGAVVSRVGETALYLFGASNDRGRDLRAGYLLHWSIITQLREDGCGWYDLGGACENPGLRQFKSGLVGKHGATPELPGYFDLAAGALNSLAARSVFKLRDYLGSARERFGRTTSTRGG